MKTRYTILASLLIIALAACRSCPQPMPTMEPEPVEREDATPVQPAPDDSPLPQPGSSPLSPLVTPPTNPAWSEAIEFLAKKLGISPTQVRVVSSESVDWPDTSLGCPQPGMMYVQVITPGYKFVLKAQGETYEIHTDRQGNNVVLCETKQGSKS